MARDLILPGWTNRHLVNGEIALDLFGGSSEVRDVFKEGARHLAAQQMQAAKTIMGVSLTNEVYDYALGKADDFTRRASQRTTDNHRTPEQQATFATLFDQLTSRYSQHISGIVEVGITGIAREIHREVIVPRPEKRGWFR